MFLVGSDLTFDPPFKVKLVIAPFNPFPFIVDPRNFKCEEELLQVRPPI